MYIKAPDSTTSVAEVKTSGGRVLDGWTSVPWAPSIHLTQFPKGSSWNVSRHYPDYAERPRGRPPGPRSWRLRCITILTGLFDRLPSIWRRQEFSVSVTQGGTEAQIPAVRPARSSLQSRCRVLDAIRSGTRYAKWAGGSRSQTHRRAAMGGFTQDDGYVRGVAPTHDCSSRSLFHELLIGRTQFSFITGSSIPIPVPGQYRLSRCLK
jgi:hypothetical protein